MEEMIVRQFTTETSHIYFINNGIITRKKITDFIKENDDILRILSGTSDNVGWCVPDVGLMFVDDKIYRVDECDIIDIMNDSKTVIIPSYQQDIVKLKYRSIDWDDNHLIKDSNYKYTDQYDSGFYNLGELPKESDKENFRRCILVQDVSMIYYVNDNSVFKQPILNYISNHRNGDWKEDLRHTNEMCGYTYDNGGILRISSNGIDLISINIWEQFMRHPSTTIDSSTSSLCDYLIVEYDSDIFTDAILGATREYKK